MKPLGMLVILCIMIVFSLECIKAQIPPTGSIKTTSRISFLQISNLSPAHGWLNTSQINCQVNCVPILTDLTKKSGFIFKETSLNYYNFINTSTLLIWAKVRFPVELAAKDYGTTGTFNIKWENSKRNPFIDPAIAYSCPLKSSDELTLCNCQLYRTAAFIIPRMLRFQNPGAQNTVVYPQAYLQPNYSFEERSK